jgi:hypothetical protein
MDPVVHGITTPMDSILWRPLPLVLQKMCVMAKPVVLIDDLKLIQEEFGVNI